MWITPLATGMADPMPRPAVPLDPAAPATELPGRPELPPAAPPPETPPPEEPPATPADPPESSVPDLEERLNGLLEAMDLAVRVHIVATPGHQLEQVRVRIRFRPHHPHPPHHGGHGHRHGRYTTLPVDAGEETGVVLPPATPAVSPGETGEVSAPAGSLDTQA